MKIAWGITGSGDKFRETYEIMKQIKSYYGKKLKIEVFLSKAAVQVAKYYKLNHELSTGFDKYWEEKDSNNPFLAGRVQVKSFDLLLIAPATSNTVAKISVGIADTLLTNSALQAVKGFLPVYIMPVDYREGIVETILPNGKILNLKVRKEDADNVRKLDSMDGFNVFENPEEIKQIIEKFVD